MTFVPNFEGTVHNYVDNLVSKLQRASDMRKAGGLEQALEERVEILLALEVRLSQRVVFLGSTPLPAVGLHCGS